MRIKRLFLTSLLVAAIALIWSSPAGAWALFTPECAACHVFPGPIHSWHIDTYGDCAICHVDPPPAPVFTFTCFVCHYLGDVIDIHGPFLDCLLCHDFVPVEEHSWSDLKNLWE